MNNKFNVIKTKLNTPPPRKNYIRREELLQELENIDDYKVTIVKGAAGSGKSTLLSSFIREKALKNIRWIGLDRDNNELTSFWYYIIEALRDDLKDEGEYFKGILSTLIKRDEIFNMLSVLINELSEAGEIIIVLDDYHYIKDRFLNEVMEYFIKYSSYNVHYVILSREELPMYLGDLRISGQVLDIDENKLKLSEAETTKFIKETLNLNVSQENTLDIFKLSEGWVAGVQLIALVLKSNKDNVVKNINGLNKYTVEYLTQEILKNTTHEENDFLIKTSVLSNFNYDMCNNILNINNSKEIIEALIAKNLFIIALDEDENVFRYHHIFKDFLNLNFSKLNEDIQKEVHIKAYNFYKNIDDMHEAIRHLIEIKLYDKALSDIKENLQSFKGWNYLKDIPLENIFQYRELTLQRIFYHFCKLEMNECKNIIYLLKNKMKDDMWSEIKTFNMLMDDYSGIFEIVDYDWVEDSDFCDITKAIMYLNSCIIFNPKDEFKKAVDYATKCEIIGRENNNLSIAIISKSQIAVALEEIGELNKARDIFNEIKKMIEENNVLKNFIFTYHLGVAGLYIKTYDLEKAEEEINLAYSYSKSNYGFADRGITYNLMEVKMLKGEIEEGKRVADRLLSDYNNTGVELMHQSIKLSYFIPSESYTVEDLEEYKKLYEEKEGDTRVYIKISDKIVYSRVIYLLGEKEKAKIILNEVIEYCRKEAIKGYLVNGLILKIIMLQEKFDENKREIFNLIREAFHYSFENRYIKPYMQEKKFLFKIIKELKAEKDIKLTLKEEEFIKILAKLSEPKEEKDGSLSEREKEVLEVLAEGASNKEIGERLNISIATVKTHVINIYSKLGVSNRVQAVEEWKRLRAIK